MSLINALEALRKAMADTSVALADIGTQLARHDEMLVNLTERLERLEKKRG